MPKDWICLQYIAVDQRLAIYKLWDMIQACLVRIWKSAILKCIQIPQLGLIGVVINFLYCSAL